MNTSGFKVEQDGKTSVLHLQGDLDRNRVSSLWPNIEEALRENRSDSLILDFGEVSRVDSAGIALIRLLEGRCESQQMSCDQRNIPEQMKEFLRYSRERASGQEQETEERPPNLVDRAGYWALGRLQASRQMVEYAGHMVLSLASALRHPKQLRFREILYQMEIAGPAALPFVIWLSGLMGFIMGIQATTTLSNFGAPIKVADVVTLGTMKEMAPLLTAIIIAGRSGAAYTAELGTMKVKEELDALEVMGINPLHFLVLPRVLALVMVGPLLTLIAEASGIIGGMIVGNMILELSAANFLTEVGTVLTPTLIYEGILKGIGFALLIGLNGCFHGLRTGSAAEDVGVKTTTAVVSGIFLIVVADALFSGIFHVYAF